MDIQSQPVPQTPPPSPSPSKKWHQHKGVMAIVILALIIGALWFLSNGKSSNPKNWRTYADPENGFEVKYPPNMFLVKDDKYSEFFIQSMPGERLFYLEDKPYKNSGFIIEVEPVGAYKWKEKDFRENIASSYDCKIDKIIPVTLSGKKSFKYTLKGDYEGQMVVIIPYLTDENLEIHFESSYKPDSPEQKKALEIFDQILHTFKFTKTSPPDNSEEERAKALTEITWKKHSNPFIEFEHSSDFEIETNKVTTNHDTNNRIGKDVYGNVHISLRNLLLSNSVLYIDILPNYTNLGDEQFSESRQIFEVKEKDERVGGDSFTMTTVDGQKASAELRPTYEHFDYDTCEGSSRLGSKFIRFYTKGYIYEISLIWTDETYNDPNSLLQKEFKRFLDSFLILNK